MLFAEMLFVLPKVLEDFWYRHTARAGLLRGVEIGQGDGLRVPQPVPENSGIFGPVVMLPNAPTLASDVTEIEAIALAVREANLYVAPREELSAVPVVDDWQIFREDVLRGASIHQSIQRLQRLLV